MSTPVSSLINLDNSFPIEYSVVLECSKNDLQKQIENVASFVSTIYARFPTLSHETREELRKKGMWFSTLKIETPTPSECEDFEKLLKQKITNTLSQEEISDCSIDLKTDYFPEKELHEVAQSAFKKERLLGALFPYKIFTRIELKEDKKKLYLNMNLKGGDI